MLNTNTAYQYLYIETWGCQMNEYDSKRMAELLEKSHGLILTENPEQGDILLFNTCSVREKAAEKLFSRLGKLRPLRTDKPNMIIGVGGCVASQEGEAIFSRSDRTQIPIDIIFGPQTLHRLPELINEVIQKRQRVIDIRFPEIEKFDHLPAPRADGPTAYVSIMEGCSKYCKYCVVPYTRGEEVNRPFEDVLKEVSGLARQGVREITLLGQNVNAYRGPMQDGGIADLGLLIHYVAEIPGVERIRFMTSHPQEFSDTLIDAFANVPKLANHLHLPVQSGSDRILSLMGRGYTALEYKSKIRQLRQYRPDITITSDFIIGYPGETDDDFMQTMDLVQAVHFDQSFSFGFSPRPGTPAATLPHQVPEEIKKQRLDIIQNRLSLQGQKITRAMVGTEQNILVTGLSKKSGTALQGRAENNRVVNFTPGTPLELSTLIGQFVRVKIIDALPNSLRGELLV